MEVSNKSFNFVNHLIECLDWTKQKTMEEKNKVEQNILEAAVAIFMEKGYDGARMRDIAQKADINISMLHYYYRSKDHLFELVFEKLFYIVYGPILKLIADPGIPLFKKIEEAVNIYTENLLKHPSLPNFIFNEVTRHPYRITENDKYREQIGRGLKELRRQIEESIDKGEIRPVSVMELIIDIESRCMFPFLTRPLWQNVFEVSDQRYLQMIENRKEAIRRSLIESLKK